MDIPVFCKAFILYDLTPSNTKCSVLELRDSYGFEAMRYDGFSIINLEQTRILSILKTPNCQMKQNEGLKAVRNEGSNEGV